MRPDMSKVLVERERIGVKGAALKRRINRRRFNDTRSFDEAPIRGPTARASLYGYECKQLNENLSPLKRFVEANVGRRWDTVYSEIREHVDFGNTVQKHILQHLWQYVERNVVMEDGIAHHPPTSFRSWRGGLVALGYDSFFVHPDTGLLSRGPKVKVAPRKPKDRKAGDARQVGQSGFNEVRVHEGAVYVKDDGVWYLADLRPLPEGITWGVPARRTRQDRRYDAIGGSTMVEVPFLDEGPTDRLLGRKVGGVPARNRFVSRRFVAGDEVRLVVAEVQRYYGRTDVYCAGKGRQLDTKALRRLGLKNS